MLWLLTGGGQRRCSASCNAQDGQPRSPRRVTQHRAASAEAENPPRAPLSFLPLRPKKGNAGPSLGTHRSEEGGAGPGEAGPSLSWHGGPNAATLRGGQPGPSPRVSGRHGGTHVTPTPRASSSGGRAEPSSRPVFGAPLYRGPSRRPAPPHTLHLLLPASQSDAGLGEGDGGLLPPPISAPSPSRGQRRPALDPQACLPLLQEGP